MGIDIRTPIGQMFVVVGALLLLYGLLGDQDVYTRSLGYNVNAIWGAVLLVFGATFWYFGRRGGRRRLQPPA